ncbi:MAG TPA: alpha-glucan family phosphorylase [Acidimicrobiales bacterium]|nr:alpha-glucan family phosphorylase [Acidimicrobiales bacterium]
MRALHSFTVRPRLPEALQPLQELAMNLRWSWDGRTRDLFRWVDPQAWQETDGDPLAVLGRVGHERLEELDRDPAFKAFMAEVYSDLQRYLGSAFWFQNRTDSPLRSVAYFSPEFGISEAVPQYSGGLGVLAGDHLKAASDLGVPLIGVGLLYRQGYFRQSLDDDGWQRERFPDLDPHAMALRLVPGVRVSVKLARQSLVAQVWRADVGRVRLYLLDSDVEENGPEEAGVTDRLYGGGTEHRLRQEILLGIGGVRALEALGEQPQVFHSNEGHAGFLGLERIRRLVVDDGLSFPEAVEAVRGASVFTTHTPVPAGIDRFPAELMEKYFSSWAKECGVSFDALMDLGHEAEDEAAAPFNMAVMGLRLSGMANAVSKLHGRVSRSMFSSLWPEVPEDEVPITSVTNGVHSASWTSPEMSAFLTRHVLPAWSEAPASAWDRLDDVSDYELWRVREQTRDRLVSTVRQRTRRAMQRRGVGPDDLAWADDILDPRILTIGFARRFATYKRATLLMSDPDRLKAMLTSSDRPVQMVFAGKAHPADDAGKELIRQVVHFAADPEVRHRFAFVEDYDMAIARALTQGADVWLNTPRRPQEACGTSGLKASLNGGLNCSIQDGWWDECFDGSNGWAIVSAEAEPDLEHRDATEAASLFALLEQHIVPLFYDRSDHVVPRRWIAKVRASLKSLGPFAAATRMVRDYVEEIYEPAATRADDLSRDGCRRAKELSAWKTRVRQGWPAVAVRSVIPDETGADLGGVRQVEAEVDLGSLTSDDVRVELIHGHVGHNDELSDTRRVAMVPTGAAAGGASSFSGQFTCDSTGRYGFTVRVVPSHPDLVWPEDMGFATWADRSR